MRKSNCIIILLYDNAELQSIQGQEGKQENNMTVVTR